MSEVTLHGKEGRPRRGGSKTILTPELADKIALHVRLGNYIETAAAFAGIAKQTLYNWLRKGARARSGIYKEFHDRMMVARAEAEILDMNAIMAAATKGHWEAAAWRLERRHPDHWARKDILKTEHVGADGGPIKIETQTPFTVTRLRKAIRELVRRELEEIGQNSSGADDGNQQAQDED